MIKLYKINTGSCGGCDIEIALAVAQATDLAWAATPYDADALLLTGPITAGSRNAVLALVGGAPLPPVLAIGRCALDGHPFGEGWGAADPDAGSAGTPRWVPARPGSDCPHHPRRPRCATAAPNRR
ncbi:MAG: NADH:ubiquinone oxidoreductase [Chloroflexaceae bacterium]|nr:NADH:ubiquinone oxidoreductase [Chloroflexaceae bacterium]